MVLVARHEGEQVVFELVLHASEQVLRNGVRAHNIAGALELVCREAGLAIKENVFGLVRKGHDQCH